MDTQQDVQDTFNFKKRVGLILRAKARGNAQFSGYLRGEMKQKDFAESHNLPHTRALFQEVLGELPRSVQFALQTHFEAKPS